MSTGAIALSCIVCSAAGSSARNARRNSSRVTLGAWAGRLRQARTIEDANALLPRLRVLTARSVRIGQVPSI
jgi:hypothetical protein